MTITIGVVANVYQEANALPGWLELAATFADWVGVMHAGPQGTKSDDGTIEILERWRVPVQFCAIDEGFGVVRTKTLRMCPCDWVMLLDADERFYPLVRVMSCTGESTPRDVVDDLLYDYGNPNYHRDGPRNRQVVQGYDKDIEFSACPSNFENLKQLGSGLTVQFGKVHDQWTDLRRIVENTDLDAVQVVRRHWHDFTFRRPTQNWHTDPDYQLRIVRNRPDIYFAPETRMHERLVGVESRCEPTNLFFDHFHCFFKPMEPSQRGHDVAIYGAVNDGKKPPTVDEWGKGQ